MTAGETRMFTCRNPLLLLVLSGLLCACATPNVAKEEARQLYSQGKVEESLARLKVALVEKPSSPELREMYLTFREQAVANWLAQSAGAISRGDSRTAETYYRRVLAVDPGNAIARTGLQLMERTSRHAKLVQEAETAVRKKDEDGARSALRTVLSEDPSNPAALRLWSALEETAAKDPAPPQLSS